MKHHGKTRGVLKYRFSTVLVGGIVHATKIHQLLKGQRWMITQIGDHRKVLGMADRQRAFAVVEVKGKNAIAQNLLQRGLE